MMMKLHSTHKSISIVVGMLIMGMVSTLSMAGNFKKIEGKFNMTYGKQEVLQVPEAQGRMLILQQATGDNKDTNGSGFMDGAQVVIREVLDLNQGSGPHRGYSVEKMPNGDQTVTSFSGEVSTVMTPEGQPHTTFSGRWEKVSGTGKYSGITGNGTYSGQMISENESVVNYEGYYYVQ